MDRSAVLAKTAKGLEEVKSRAHGLPQKQRTILIMVDGTATVGTDTAAASTLEVSFNNGTSWTTVSGNVTIPAGSTSVQLRVE